MIIIGIGVLICIFSVLFFVKDLNILCLKIAGLCIIANLILVSLPALFLDTRDIEVSQYFSEINSSRNAITLITEDGVERYDTDTEIRYTSGENCIMEIRKEYESELARKLLLAPYNKKYIIFLQKEG